MKQAKINYLDYKLPLIRYPDDAKEQYELFLKLSIKFYCSYDKDYDDEELFKKAEILEKEYQTADFFLVIAINQEFEELISKLSVDIEIEEEEEDEDAPHEKREEEPYGDTWAQV